MPKKRICNVDGCEKPQCPDDKGEDSGVCQAHWEENYRLECGVDGCERRPFAKGKCQAHYMRTYRKKKGEKAPPVRAPVRGYDQTRVDVFTRIGAKHAEVILQEAGREDGMYELAALILTEWAEARLAQGRPARAAAGR